MPERWRLSTVRVLQAPLEPPAYAFGDVRTTAMDSPGMAPASNGSSSSDSSADSLSGQAPVSSGPWAATAWGAGISAGNATRRSDVANPVATAVGGI